MYQPDYYQQLQIPDFANMDQVKQAYRKLARKYHPDVTRLDSRTAEEKMKQLNGIYAVLGDESSKEDYDGWLRWYYSPKSYAQPQVPPQKDRPIYKTETSRWNLSPYAAFIIVFILFRVIRHCDNPTSPLQRNGKIIIHLNGKSVDSILNNIRQERKSFRFDTTGIP